MVHADFVLGQSNAAGGNEISDANPIPFALVDDTSTRGITSTTATIANGAQTSGVVSTGGLTISSIKTPATLNTITSLTFTVCETSGGTYVPLYDETGTQLSLTVAAGRAYALPLYWFAGWQYVKLIPNVAATADRAFDLQLIAV